MILLLLAALAIAFVAFSAQVLINLAGREWEVTAAEVTVLVFLVGVATLASAGLVVLWRPRRTGESRRVELFAEVESTSGTPAQVKVVASDVGLSYAIADRGRHSTLWSSVDAVELLPEADGGHRLAWTVVGTGAQERGIRILPGQSKAVAKLRRLLR